MRRLLEAGALTVLLVGQIVLFARLLHTAPDFDEGVYLLALDALRHGQSLGNDVFGAQPPGFYALLRGDSAIFGFGITNVRVGVIVLGAVGAIGAWLLCRTQFGAAAGLLAVALITIAPPVPLFGARILADLPALWISLLGVGFAAYAARPDCRHARVAAGVAGALCTFAPLVKLNAVVCLPIAALLLVTAQAWRRLLVAAAIGASAVAVAMLIVHLTALPEIWEGAVQYHGDARHTPDVIDRWKAIRGLFNLRTPFFWLTAGGLVVFLVRLARREANRIEIAVWAWTGLALFFLATHQPLHYNHLVMLPVVTAVASALSIGGAWQRARPRPRAASACAIAVLLAAGYVQQTRRVPLDDVPIRDAIVATAAAVKTLTGPRDFVVSDQPLVGVLADRRSPGPLVDASRLRFVTGSLTPASVLRTIDTWCVQAVVAGRAFLDQPRVLDGLSTRFQRRRTIENISLYFDPHHTCVTHQPR